MVDRDDHRIELRRVALGIRQGWSPNCLNEPADGIDTWGILRVGCSNSGVFRPEDNKALPPDEPVQFRHVVREGEIVLSRSNTADLVGMAASVLGSYPKLMLSDLHYALTPKRGVDSAYLAYAMRGTRVRANLKARAKGTSSSMQKLAQRDVLGVSVRIPSWNDQRRMVEHLDRSNHAVERLVSGAERLIRLSRERRSALITAAVTGQIDVSGKV